MTSLKEMIVEHGRVFPGDVLKVDSFLNHQIDPQVISSIEEEICEYFKGKEITKIMTVEASGIAPALMLAYRLKVPMLFAKKSLPSSLKSEDKYETIVHSYTKNVASKVVVAKEYLSSDDKVLIVDDFLANGEAAFGLTDLINQAGAETVGIGICIEKSFQPGRERLEEAGYDVFSVCRIKSLDNNEVTFM